MLRSLLAACACFLLAAPPALAFASITWGEAVQDVLIRSRPRDPKHDHGYRHREITARAIAGLGFSEDARKLLGWQNFLTDWDQYHHTPARPPNERYRPGDHFDRNEGETSAMAFRRGLAALQARRLETARLLERGEVPAGLTVLGQALHGLQDCYAHTNMVDLSADDRRAVLSAQLGQAAEVPAAVLARLRVTGTSRRAMRDLAPAEDREPGFGHDRFSKDNATTNREARSPSTQAAGLTKFQHAVELATGASRAFVLRVRQDVSPAAWQKALAYQAPAKGQ
jgi:hypothetical protein